MFHYLLPPCTRGQITSAISLPNKPQDVDAVLLWLFLGAWISLLASVFREYKDIRKEVPY